MRSPFVEELTSKSFRAHCVGPSHLLLLAQEKVTQEKGTSRPRPACIPALRVRESRSGFCTGHPWPVKNLAGIPAGDPSGKSTASRRSPGARLERGLLPVEAEAEAEADGFPDVGIGRDLWRPASAFLSQ
jgi:hypothetical protein